MADPTITGKTGTPAVNGSGGGGGDDGLNEFVDADPQDTEAVRAIIRSEMGELVNELGMPRGPRVQRVDSLFSLLIAYSPISPAQVAGSPSRNGKRPGVINPLPSDGFANPDLV